MDATFVPIRSTPDGSALRARFFRALGDPKRLKILGLLLTGEKTVGDLVNLLDTPQGRVSNHLACLRWCGFVEARRDGKFVYYRLADPRVRDLIRTADAIIGDHAAALASCTRVAGDEAEANPQTRTGKPNFEFGGR